MLKKFFSVGATLLMSLCLLCSCGMNGDEYVDEGSLCSIETAYENGWLTQENVRDIAYYYHAMANEYYDEGYTANPKVPNTLDAETEQKIKITYLYSVIKNPSLSIKNIYIGDYYGTYGDCIAVGIDDSYLAVDLIFYPEYEIGGVIFHQFSPAGIRIWKANC